MRLRCTNALVYTFEVQHNWSSVQWLTKTVRMRMLWLLQLLKYFPSKQNHQKALLQRILSIKTSRAQMRQLEPYLDSSLKYYRFNFILFHKYSRVRISDGRRLYTSPCGIWAKSGRRTPLSKYTLSCPKPNQNNCWSELNEINILINRKVEIFPREFVLTGTIPIDQKCW